MKLITILLTLILSLICLSGSIINASELPPACEEYVFQEDPIIRRLNELESEIIQLNKSNNYSVKMTLEYMNIVIESRRKNYYGKATKLYIDNISKVSSKNKLFLKEAEILSHLIAREDGDNRDKYKKLLKKKSDDLGIFIKDFWARQNIDPTTEYNERLIEHFERIQYAKKFYTKNKNSVIGTDDRGLIYLKYGSPHRGKSGQLGTNTGELFQRAGDVFDVLARHNDRGEVTVMLSSAPKITTVSNVVNYVTSMDNQPRYEIWLYQFDKSREPIYFIFGRKNGKEDFGLRNSVDEFIPKNYFGTTKHLTISYRNHNESISVGSFLQILYYSNVEMVSHEFGRQFSELNSVWNMSLSQRKMPSKSVMRSQQTINIGRGKSNMIKNTYEEPKSKYESVINPIDISAQQFRFLRNNEPKIGVIVTSFPGGYKLEDIVTSKNIDELVDKVLVEHTMILNDGHWDILEKVVDRPSGDKISFFSFPHMDKSFKYVVTSKEIKPDSADFMNTDLDDRLENNEKLQFGKVILENMSPLSTNLTELELSDLVIGVDSGRDMTYGDISIGFLPSNRFIFNSQMSVYLEIYNLLLGEGSYANFTVEYNIVPLERKFGIKKLFERKGKKSVTQSNTYTSKERNINIPITLDISNLKKGNYKLVLTVKDKVGNMEKNRSVNFEIVGIKQK